MTYYFDSQLNNNFLLNATLFFFVYWDCFFRREAMKFLKLDNHIHSQFKMAVLGAVIVNFDGRIGPVITKFRA